MPEVREILERQIAPANRSFEVMAVIGAEIDLIYWIDKNWLADQARALFRLEGLKESPPISEGWAAWNAFLVWVKPHIELYKVFKEQFAYAVTQSIQVGILPDAHEQPMEHLGEHLMILYGRGNLGLDEDDGTVRRFLENANSGLRQHTIRFIGNTLTGQEEIPEEVVNRFKTLWDDYWHLNGKSDTADKPDSFVFGTWFSSGKFPADWSLQQLENLLELSCHPKRSSAILKQLAELANAHPVKSVHILDLIFRNDRQEWHTHESLNSTRRVLEIAMRYGGSARVHAKQVIHYLGRRGYTELGELLNTDLSE
jgi:hypothetical protein